MILISGVLEHILEPEKLVARLATICHPATRVIVNIPWRENLESYRSLDYEFTHLRSFDSYTFSAMWPQFELARRLTHYPNMREPLVFRLEERLPLPIYNWLAERYSSCRAGPGARGGAAGAAPGGAAPAGVAVAALRPAGVPDPGAEASPGDGPRRARVCGRRRAAAAGYLCATM